MYIYDFFFCSFTVFTQIYHVCMFKFMITSLLGSPVYVASVWQEQEESRVHLPCVMTKISCNICFAVFQFYWRQLRLNIYRDFFFLRIKYPYFPSMGVSQEKMQIIYFFHLIDKLKTLRMCFRYDFPRRHRNRLYNDSFF